MKKFIALGLSAVIISTMSFAVLAADDSSYATVDITITDEAGNDLDPDGPAVIISVPDLEFDDVRVSLTEEVESSAIGSAEMRVGHNAFALQVSIGDFEIDDYVTMEGFEIDLEFDAYGFTGNAEVEAFDVTLYAGVAPQTLLTAEASDNTLAIAYVDFDAELWAPAGSAYRIGEAEATLYWTVVPTVVD
ncbi:MAG: hypothetical protein FWD98_00530 [Defluviitaleaceae bacterium]|nr:hypothetical protein [Defluviitaleaceae bacterium]